MKVIHFLFLTALFLAILICGDSSIVYARTESVYKYNEAGVEKLQRKDYRGAIIDFKAAHHQDPYNKKINKNLSIAYNNYGFALMGQGQLSLAIEQFESALYYDETNPYTFYNLGQAYYRVQNIPKAKYYLEKAFALKPDIKGLRSFLEKVQREVSVEKGFEKLETMHFIVASSPGVPLANLSYIRTYLEEAYGRVGQFLGYYPQDKVVTLLYSEQDYQALLKSKPHWALALYDGKLRIPINKLAYTNEDVIKIIYHEYSHALIRQLAQGRCPQWLNEGIASNAEALVVAPDRAVMKHYIEHFGLIPFNKIPDNFTGIRDGNIATLLYIESYLLVSFIMRRSGYQGLENMLRFIGQGVNSAAVVEKFMGMNLAEFQKQWERYIIEYCALSEIQYYK